MDQLNHVELRGRIGLVRLSPVAERSVCRFSVATNSIFHNAENVLVEEVTWHTCTLWSSKRFPDLSFIRAGLPVEVDGRLRSSKYTGTDGVERYSTEIIVSDLRLLPEGEQLRPAMI